MQRRSRVVVLSVLLAVGFVGCKEGGNKKEPVGSDEGFTGNSGVSGKPSAMEAYEKKVEQARAGETVDFYGDGSTFRMWTGENGVLHTESKGTADNPYHYVSATYPDGSSEITYSASADGIIDFQKERLVDGTVIEHHYGTLRDGDFDKRVTYTEGPEEDTVRIVIEQRTLEGEWQKEEEFVRPNLISCDQTDAGTNSNSNMTVPLVPQQSAQQKTHGAALEESAAERSGILYNYEPFGGKGELGITILTGPDVTKHCTPEQGLKILSALEAMFELYMRCLHKTNPKMTAEIDRVMSSKDYVVNIGCRVLENNTPAAATPYSCTAKSPCKIWFNSNRINVLSEMKLQETMLHEFLHTVGFDVDNPARHDREQNDKTYSCGRYCTGCAGRTTSQSSTDCARCADTLERKKLSTLVLRPAGRKSTCTQGMPQLGSFKRVLLRRHIYVAPGGDSRMEIQRELLRKLR